MPTLSSNSAALEAFPQYSRAETLLDLALHAIGLVAASIGLTVLAISSMSSASGTGKFAFAAYALGLMAMYVFSTLYHLAPASSTKAILRRFDHSAAFLFIAGSYAPVTLIAINTGFARAMFAFVIIGATIGVTTKLVWPRRYEGLAIGLYVTLGWCILLALPSLYAATGKSGVILLLGGNLVYSIGVGFHHATRLPFHNALWHLCVLIAAVLHFVAIYAIFTK